MKICQLIDFTNIGGAGIAATRIGNAVKKVYDYNFTEISSNCSTLTEKTIPLQNSRKVQILNVLSSFIDNDLLKRYKNRDLNRQLKKILCSENPDVINIHNLHSSDWPISLVKTCLKHSPVLWTLHDCWSFLGTYYPSHSPAPSKT